MAIRMRTTLLLCLISIPCGVVLLSLAVLHYVLQAEIHREIDADLDRSISTFRNLQAHREQMLRREVSLLAALPLLKSLMTTSDEGTIRDGAAEFADLSGGDLFALANGNGKVIAVFEGGSARPPTDLAPSFAASSLSQAQTYYLRGDKGLYEAAFQPLYFGAESGGTRLGYVLLGYAVDRRLAEEVDQAASSQVIFYSDKSVVATTLDDRYKTQLAVKTDSLLNSADGGRDIWLAGEHFVHASVLLSGTARPQVQLVALKSFDRASQYVTRLNLTLILLGGVLLVLSATLAVYLSTSITRPLDRLVAGARALGSGDFEYPLQQMGVREIRELADAFDLMRSKLKSARDELLIAERLATIGRMASSISHDLRHYLSAVYANAEFLGYDSTRPEERQELLAEVRQGVRGMTDLIDSLLLFSRTGETLQVSCESVPYLVERAVALARAHPDAVGVRFAISSPMPQVEAWIDARKVERALYNLLLNACQAARQGSHSPEVRVALAENDDLITSFIIDNGPGVAQSLRDSLFQPFVSGGKPSGTGLGLTLALKIAQEHGGTIVLEESRDGLTVFQFAISKTALRENAEAAQRRKSPASIS